VAALKLEQRPADATPADHEAASGARAVVANPLEHEQNPRGRATLGKLEKLDPHESFVPIDANARVQQPAASI
jgi:hypothetical protein